MANSLYITNARVYQNHAFVRGNVLVENGRIIAVETGSANQSDRVTESGNINDLGSINAFGNEKVLDGIPTLDAQGKTLVPGFIDIHTHGAAGVDVNAADVEGLSTIAKFFASQGTTSWNASVLTDAKEQTLWCIDQLKAFKKMQREEGPTGANLLGIHLEGPFLSQEYKGAMPEYLLKDGDPELFREYTAHAEGLIDYVTIAPEVIGAVELIQQITSEKIMPSPLGGAGKVTVAIGHSAADYDTSWAAIRAGARTVTHTFNAMKLFHQHFPAIMGAALESDLYCEAICDGRHLHPGTVRMLLKCKGWNRVIAITDSIMAAGLPDGAYKLGVNDVIVQDGDAKLLNGVRAGSTLTTGQALKNLLKFTGHPLEDVLPLLTENPAEALGIGLNTNYPAAYWEEHAKVRAAEEALIPRKGYIRPGFDADLVLLDEGHDVTCTIVGGQVVYQK